MRCVMLSPSAPPTTLHETLYSEYTRRLARNSLYSLRAFARDLGISHSHLSRVLSQKKRLSLRQAGNVAERLGKRDPDRAAFIQAVAEQWTRPLGQVSKNLFPSTRKNSHHRSSLLLEVERFQSISEWHHCAILELLSIKSFRATPSSIAARMGLTPSKVRASLLRLQRLGLASQKEKYWVRTHRDLIVPSLHADAAARAFHRSMILKALQVLERSQGEDLDIRDISGTTIAIDPARLPEAKKRITKFRQSLMRYLGGGNPSLLYQLNVQLFSIEARKEKPE